ncbi:MAG: polysaccharide pyruvyl transferase CsaB [Armatimonadota bacterium]
MLFSGYYGFGNLGDEAILAASIAALRAARPDLDIEVLSADPRRTARQYGVRGASRSNPLHILAALRRADLLLSGGGGLLQDVTSPASPLYYLGILRLAQLLRRKTMVFAQGIGPLHSRRSIALTLSCSRRANAITVRDEASAQWLRERGLDDSDIVVAGDPALLLEACPRERACEILAGNGAPGDGRRIGICVRPWHTAPHLVRTLASLADELARELDAHVLLLPFHPHLDLEPCRNIARLTGRPATVLEGTLSPGEALGVIARLDLLIGMRLHSLILGALAGAPLLGISYDPKVDAFLESLGLRAAASAEALDGAVVRAAAHEAMARSDRQQRRLRDRVEGLKEAAQRSIQGALSLLD